MIRPKNFGSNPETISNNAFQNSPISEATAQDIQQKALEEFDLALRTLQAHDVNVIVFEDRDQPVCPDAIFPNNWISLHGGKHLITYPMYAPSRRAERRNDIIEFFEKEHGFTKRYTFEYLEEENQFCEGTGSIVLDRENKIMYACLSERTDIRVLDKFAVVKGYRKICFHAAYANNAIYHTNVMMSMGDKYVVICMDAILEESEKSMLLDSFKSTQKTVIDISLEQMANFCGNILQIRSQLGEPIVVMSDSAYGKYDAKQLDMIGANSKILSIPIPTIEKYSGGSIRCMLAEVHF
ncbi:MAG: amidinotransferase [Saprospiraceae bacterium]|nr:amidinotransferase [Saprospiraceae bacterium]